MPARDLILIAVMSLGSLALNIFGPLLAGGRTPPVALQRVIISPPLPDHLPRSRRHPRPRPAPHRRRTPRRPDRPRRRGQACPGPVCLDARRAGLKVRLITLALRASLAIALLSAVTTTTAAIRPARKRVRLNPAGQPVPIMMSIGTCLIRNS